MSLNPTEKVEMGKPPFFFLAGFMGAGKTSVGRLVSDLLCADWVDLDDEIEKRSRKSILELFSNGEEKFRIIEEQVLSQLLQGRNQKLTLLSLGGGTLLKSSNRNLIRNAGISIYLKNTPENLWNRCRFDSRIRPLALDYSEFLGLYQKRDLIYEKCDWVISADQFTLEEVAKAVLARVRLYLESLTEENQ